MKLKYYLRGLGIGILVTTVILSLAGVGRKNMTDEEVVKRAKELGMVESTLLSDLPDQTKTDEVTHGAGNQPAAGNIGAGAGRVGFHTGNTGGSGRNTCGFGRNTGGSGRNTGQPGGRKSGYFRMGNSYPGNRKRRELHHREQKLKEGGNRGGCRRL